MTTAEINEKVQAALRNLAPTQEKVDRAVRIAIEEANPSRVIVFGSWARGEAKWDSDVDLAVLLPDSEKDQVGEIRRALRRKLDELPVCIDLIAATESDAGEYRSAVNSIFYRLFKEGQIVYEHGSALKDASAAD
jgi:predicted nucleotidyltransferase